MSTLTAEIRATFDALLEQYDALLQAHPAYAGMPAQFRRAAAQRTLAFVPEWLESGDDAQLIQFIQTIAQERLTQGLDVSMMQHAVRMLGVLLDPLIADVATAKKIWDTLFKVQGTITQLVMGVLRQDITERKRLEQQIHESLARREQQVQTSTEVAQEIAAAPALDELFHRVVALIKERFDYYHAQILRYDPALDAVVLVTGYGEAGRRMLAAGHKLAIGRGVVGTAAATGQSILATDVAQGKDWRPNPHLPNTQGELAVPIKLRDEVLGILDVQSETAGALTAEDQLLLEGLCGQIAIAIDNVRLVEKTQTALAETQLLLQLSSSIISFENLPHLLQSVVDNVTELLTANRVSLISFDLENHVVTHFVKGGSGSSQILTTVTFDELWDGLSGWALQERKPALSLKDVPDPRESPAVQQRRCETDCGAIIVTPLIYRDRVLGTMTAINRADEANFTQKDVDLMVAFANQAAVAIENARLFEETQNALNEVRQSEELMRTLIDATPDWIFIKDREHRYRLANQGYANALHVRPEDFIGKDDLELGFPEELVKGDPDKGIRGFWADDQLVIDTGETQVYPNNPATIDGVVHTFHTIKTPVRDADGRIWGVLAFARDVTEREHFLADQQKRSLQLQTAAEVSRAASSILDLDELLVQMVNLIQERFDLYYTGLFLVDAARRYTVLRAGTGEAGRQMLARGHQLALDENSMIGWCILNEQARIALDVGQDATHFENPLLPETRSELALPLIARGRPLGAVTVQSVREAAFTEADVTALQTMADQVANAIVNARLFEETQRRVSELATLNEIGREFAATLSIEETCQAVYRQVDRLFKADNFVIGGYQEGSREWLQLFEMRGGQPGEVGLRRMGRDLASFILGTRQPVLLRDIEENERFHLEQSLQSTGPTAASWMGAPLLAGGAVVGLMMIQEDARERVYDEQHLALFSTIASQAAIAFQNARLFERARRHAEESAALNELSRTLSTRLDVRQVLEQVYQGVLRLLNVDSFYIGLYDADRNEVTFPLNVTESVVDWQITVIPADQGLTGYIIQRGESLLIQANVAEWLARKGMEPVEEPAQSWLGVPMMIGDQVLGVMAVQDYRQPNAYDEYDRDLLESIAAQATIAIQNARLFEETQEALNEVQQSEELMRTLIDATPDWIFVKDQDHRYRLVNASYARALRLKPEDFIGKSDLEVGFSEDVVKGDPDREIRGFWTDEREAMDTDRMVTSPRVPITLDGVVHMFDDMRVPLHDAEGRVWGVLGISRDVTEREQVDARMRETLQELEHLYRAATRAGWQTFHETGRLAAGYHFDRINVLPAEDLWMPQIKRAVEENTFVSATEQEAVAVTPLAVRGEIIGAVGVYDDPQHLLSADEWSLLQEIIEQGALALENARLFEESQRRAVREQVTAQVTARIRESLDMETVLKTAAKEMHRSLGLDKITIHLGTSQE